MHESRHDDDLQSDNITNHAIRWCSATDEHHSPIGLCEITDLSVRLADLINGMVCVLAVYIPKA